ncbi:unnamed protein product [Clavelina lepadiformis]|uniref:Uncharacterized protein n=1 Tax=Clavelina lepadiformis TaxID=159417 RepID=A0ABP0FUJ5_CLALP
MCQSLHYISMGLCFTLFLLKICQGCHSPYHGGSFQNVNGEFDNESDEDRTKRLLSGHGLSKNIINCVVNEDRRKKREIFNDDERRFSSHLFPPPDFQPMTLEQSCNKYMHLCETVMACAQLLNIDIPELSFLTPSTTPTTTTTTTTPSLPPIDLPNLSKLPTFPKPCFKCSGFLCKFSFKSNCKK